VIRYRAVELDATDNPVDAAEGEDYCAGPWDAAACAAPLVQVDLVRDEIGRIGIAERRIGQPPIAGATRLPDPRPVHWRGYAYTSRRHLADAWEASPLVPPDPPDPYRATRSEVQARAAASAGWAYDREAAVGDLRQITLTGGSRRRWALGSPRDPGHELVRVEVDGTTSRVLHDDAGRVVRHGARTFGHHPAGSLATVRDRGTLVEGFAYAADGRLAAVWTAEQATPETVFGYDAGQQTAAADPTAGLRWEAAWGPGVDRLLEWTDLTAGADRQIPLLDERGSVLGTWSPSTARLLGTIDEDPEGRRTVFGQEGQRLCEEVGTGDVCATPGGAPFGLTGGWRSPRTALVWRRARWYAPQLGQWLTRDPRGAIDSHNGYAYAACDPVNLVDPSGRASGGPAAAAAPPTRGTGPISGPGTAAIVLGSFPGVDPVPGGPWPPGRLPPDLIRGPRLPLEELGRGTGREILEEALRGIRRRPSRWGSFLRDVQGLLRWVAENPELVFAATMLYSTAAGDPRADQDIARYHIRNEIARRIREPLRNWVPIVEPPARPTPRGDPGSGPPVTAPPTVPTSPWVDPLPPGEAPRQLGPLDPERHHIFPQTFEWYFNKKGIDIDKYTVELGQAWHKAVHRAGFNIEWEMLIQFDEAMGGVLTPSDVFEIGVEMAERYGVIGAVVPYNGGLPQQTDIPAYLGAPRP
jgi:RHS repeat-associated protein